MNRPTEAETALASAPETLQPFERDVVGEVRDGAFFNICTGMARLFGRKGDR